MNNKNSGENHEYVTTIYQFINCNGLNRHGILFIGDLRMNNALYMVLVYTLNLILAIIVAYK